MQHRSSPDQTGLVLPNQQQKSYHNVDEMLLHTDVHSVSKPGTAYFLIVEKTNKLRFSQAANMRFISQTDLVVGLTQHNEYLDSCNKQISLTLN